MSSESRYELLDKVGSGGFATVYRARDTELGREVAVKQIHDQYLGDPTQLERYWQEAQLLASLHHPNIVTIFDIQRERGWLIMELMQGNLRERLSGRQMDLKSLRTTLAHCLRALKYLHSLGIVHGDIKPSNMMLDSRRRVKIGDFGLARRVSDEEGSLLKGTTKYMAPEVVSEEFGEVGPPSDLYSLGFSAYELMCGSNFETLFPGLSAFGRNKQVAWMMWHAAADRRLPEISRVLEGVPEDLQKVIQRLVDKDQQKRYATADDALSDLKIDLKLVKTGETPAEETVETPLDGAARKRRLIAVGGFALSFLLCAVMLFMPGEEKVVVKDTRTYGVIRELDADVGRVVIEDIETGVPQEVNLGKKPHIFLRNTKRNILMRELKVGDRVSIDITKDPSGQPDIDITADRAVASSGRITSIDLPNQRVVIDVTAGGMRGELPLRVPTRATVLLNTEPVQIRDLAKDDQADVTHFAATGGAFGRVAEKLSARRPTRAAGFVQDYDSIKGELIVRFGRGGKSPPLKRPIADGCILRREDPDASTDVDIDALTSGTRINFTYDTEYREITIARKMSRVTGTVQKADPGTNHVTVRATDGTTFDFAMRQDANVWLNRDAVTVSDLRKFDDVDVFYNPTAEKTNEAGAIDASRPVKNDRWAIIIGAQNYSETFLTPLSYGLASANCVRDAMINRYAMNPDRVITLLDETADEIRAKIEAGLKRVRHQTQLIVYISCHAYVDDEGHAYLAARDFNWDEMAETGLPLAWLVEQLEACASEDKILLLDTCHVGDGKDLRRQPSTSEILDHLTHPMQSTSAIASCSEGERGQPGESSRYSLFAYYVALGFDGGADSDRDLHITADELFKYVASRMMSASGSDASIKQTPTLFAPQ